MQIELSGKNIHYEDLGEGKNTILMVHGWGGSIKSLQPLAQLLSKYTRVLLLDLPGFGESSLPDSDWGVSEYGELVKNFIEKQNLTGCLYFGHSFGGAIGVYLASTYPNLLNKLILAAPSYKRPQHIYKDSYKPGYLKKLDGTNKGPITRWVKKIYYKLCFPQSDSMKYPELEPNFRRIIKEDLTQLTQGINCPTLILWGELDKDVSVNDAYLLDKNVLNSKLKVYPGATHGFPLSNPEVVYKDIKEFLQL